MPNWSPWPSCRRCSDSPPKHGGYATPANTLATCSPTCPTNPATTNGCGGGAPRSPPWQRWWAAAPPPRPPPAGWWGPPKKPPPPLGSGRVGAVRLLRLTLTLLLGPAPAPGLHPGRATGRVRVDRRESRRTTDPAGHLGRRSHSGRPPAGADPHRRQALLRQGLRGHPDPGRDQPVTPSTQRRAFTRWCALVQTITANHRIAQSNLQRTTRPGTPRRPHP